MIFYGLSSKLRISEYFGYGKEPSNFRYVGKFYKHAEDELVKVRLLKKISVY